MLNTNEVQKLEKRWRRYRNRKILRISILSFLCLLVLLSPVVYIKRDKLFGIIKSKEIQKTLKKDTKKVETKPEKVETKPEKKEAMPEKSAIKPIKADQNNSKKVVMEKNETNGQKSTLAHIATKKIDKKDSNETLKGSNVNRVLTLNTKFLDHIFKDNNPEPENIQKNSYSENKDKKRDISDEKPPQSKVKKHTILISSKKIDKIKYLKERFNETNKFIYAKLLSKEYYKRAKYKKALKWAIIANDLNSSDEESWILFAKSKVKLGKIDDAVNALSAYLKVNNSLRVKALLKKIKNGEIR